MKKDRRLFPHEAEYLGLDVKKADKHGNPRYYIEESLFEDVVNRFRKNPKKTKKAVLTEDEEKILQGIREACDSQNLSIENVPHGWITDKLKPSLFFKNPAYKTTEEKAKEIDFEAIIQKYIKPFEPTTITGSTGSFGDRLVYTDVHIAMDPNKNGHSLYGGKWDEEEILGRLDEMVAHVLKKKDSNILLIDELGDFMDGWDGETVRKGHALPQNMDNEKAFDVGLHFKIKLIDQLIPYYEKIICHNICNDNHAGSFGYVVNKAFKTFIEFRYSNVEVVNVRKFIDHYKFGKTIFVLSHGKDGKSLKFGLKPKIDPVQIEKIKNYIDEHFLLQPDQSIVFSKGDSHQDIMDKSSSDSFDYYNYPAFSPSSEWVQTNYKRGISGFYFYNLGEDGSESIHPYYFKWKTNREEITIDFSEFANKRTG